VHDKVKTRVKTEIARVSQLSFTTDAWSSSGCGCSLLSLTAHWLFVKKFAVLYVQPLKGYHTGSSIQENVSYVLWAVSDISDLLPPLEVVIRQQFIPAPTGQPTSSDVV